jgi:hypothetical protein
VALGALGLVVRLQSGGGNDDAAVVLFGPALFSFTRLTDASHPQHQPPPNKNQLGIPTDFVKKSKLERELIQLDKDLAPRKEKLAQQATDYEGMVAKAKVCKFVDDG